MILIANLLMLWCSADKYGAHFHNRPLRIYGLKVFSCDSQKIV